MTLTIDSLRWRYCGSTHAAAHRTDTYRCTTIPKLFREDRIATTSSAPRQSTYHLDGRPFANINSLLFHLNNKNQ